jgi:hypothetical protein
VRIEPQDEWRIRRELGCDTIEAAHGLLELAAAGNDCE